MSDASSETAGLPGNHPPPGSGKRWFIIIPAIILVGTVSVVAASYFRVFAPEPPKRTEQSEVGQTREATIEDALQMILAAREKFSAVKDYSCIYLRDEFIDGKLKKNHIKLKVRHKPFSVRMDWVSPKSKSGRLASWIEGRNDGKMRVKMSKLLPTVSLDPKRSITMRESLHTINEAGLLNMISRFSKSWEKESKESNTEVEISNGIFEFHLGETIYAHDCTCITTLHRPEDREKYRFYRTTLYFDKQSGLPIRLQGYDWPTTPEQEETQLVEDFTYLDIKQDVGLTEKDFEW